LGDLFSGRRRGIGQPVLKLRTDGERRQIEMDRSKMTRSVALNLWPGQTLQKASGSVVARGPQKENAARRRISDSTENATLA